jgi:hypothetical protein
MLRKALFIGVGGSGGRTLQYLQQELHRRLRASGNWDPRAGLPAGWQFRWVDVPPVQENAGQQGPPALPAGSYVPLAQPNVQYADVYDVLTQHADPAAFRALGGWLPDRQRAPRSVADGAGQFRAIGSAVLTGRPRAVRQGLKEAMTSLRNADMREVSTALGDAEEHQERDPLVVLVSSLAGGAGAGAVLDIADLLRAEVEAWTSGAIAVFYTPDVFSSLAQNETEGVHGNTLATLGELLSGRWRAGAEPLATADLLGVAGIARGSSGPRYPLLVGAGNDAVTMPNPNATFRAVAGAMAAWATDPDVQQRFVGHVLTNMDAAAAAGVGELPLGEDTEPPFSSFGYAKVGLGRDRFAEYAAQRLAKQATDRLRRGHWSRVDTRDQTAEQAIEDVAQRALLPFLDRCGLWEEPGERGAHHAILEALQRYDDQREDETGTDTVTGVLEGFRDTVRRQLNLPRDGDAPDNVARRMWTVLREQWPDITSSVDGRRQTAAVEWVQEIQQRVVYLSGEHLGIYGLQATAKLLEKAADRLRGEIARGLHDESTANEQRVRDTARRLEAALQRARGKVTRDSTFFDNGLAEGVQALRMHTDAVLSRRAARLAEELADGLFEPLRATLAHEANGLEEACQGTAAEPSPYSRWSDRDVPQHLWPAEYEHVLDDVDAYPQTFEELVDSSTGDQTGTDGINETVLTQLIAGVADQAGLASPIGLRRQWAPREPLPMTEGAPATAAQISVDLDLDELYDRAHAWCRRPDTTIRDHLDETLAGWLDGGEAPQWRCAQLLDALRNANGTSEPLIRINDRTVLRLRGHQARDVEGPGHTTVMTRLPIPNGHAAREPVEELLREFGYAEEQLPELFTDAKAGDVEVTRFLSRPLHLPAFDSVARPVVEDWHQRRHQPDQGGFWRWRRSRPLPEAIPASSRGRQDMIRGWAVAWLLGRLESEDPRTEPISLVRTDGSRAPFPYPLLGAPNGVSKEDILPAVLESLLIALTEFATAEDNPLAAYEGLIELGQTSAHQEPLPPELRRWITTGQVGPALQVPLAERAGPPSEPANEGQDLSLNRLDTVIKSLEGLRAWRQRIAEPPGDAAALAQCSRAWELGSTLLEAYDELLEECRLAREQGVGGEDDPFGV